MLFRDDVRLRQRTGLVLFADHAVALLGAPGKMYLEQSDLDRSTRWSLNLQGEPYRSRWKALWTVEPRSSRGQSAIYLSAIAVFRGWRGRGIGSALLTDVLGVGRARGANVECQVSSSSLVKWYEARGFELLREEVLSPGFSVFDLVARTGDEQLDGSVEE